MRRCGGCVSFIKYKTGHGKVRALCDEFDYNVTSDTDADRCNGFIPLKYKREKKSIILSFLILKDQMVII